ncbi:DUF433 domain-containing protein [Telluribacter sp.]|jgi:uncharacterized protein (DUF433 family)|uniref:DUF433 domain-containing protein n=1 Tax=Telluribacter sp. TaxID=1978767 RepID=UPI002E11959D|nr:DUF433 domain-containing protein [Telluribacter sp.]
MEYIADRITIDPDLCNGKPTIRGKRITVQTILGFLSAGDSKEDILEQYPSLEAEDIDACLRFASKLMENQYDFRQTA